MINPLRFRPETPARSPEPEAQNLTGDTAEWQDNWLSNGVAWASRAFLPAWCHAPGHWTSRVVAYLHTSCPCCLFFRGLALGLPLGGVIGLGVGVIL